MEKISELYDTGNINDESFKHYVSIGDLPLSIQYANVIITELNKLMDKNQALEYVLEIKTNIFRDLLAVSILFLISINSIHT